MFVYQKFTMALPGAELLPNLTGGAKRSKGIDARSFKCGADTEAGASLKVDIFNGLAGCANAPDDH